MLKNMISAKVFAENTQIGLTQWQQQQNKKQKA